MSIVLHCNNCGETYVCMIENTRIYGPIIETRCPNCSQLTVKNITAFVEDQVSAVGKINAATLMIKLATDIGKKVNDDFPYKISKKARFSKDGLPEL